MIKLIPFFAALAIAMPLHAESTTPPTAPAAAMAPMSDAVVRKVDAAAGKITLKHGPIANLDMPPMTMVFRVQPPELIDKVKAGDTVKFRAEDIGGNFTVTAIEKVQ